MSDVSLPTDTKKYPDLLVEEYTPFSKMIHSNKKNYRGVRFPLLSEDPN